MYKGKLLFAALVLASATVACQSNPQPPPPPPSVVSVVINQPSVTTLNAGQSVNLTAKVTFTTATTGESVTWSIVSGGGTLSNQSALGATFTAPSQASASITTIKATSVQDPSKFGTGELNINAAGSSTITAVTITPPSSTNLTTSASINLSVAVTGTGAFNPAVTWEVSASSGATGFLTNQTNTGATYTAPSQANTVTVRAISVQDSSKTSQVVFNITASGDTTPPTIASTTATSSTTVVIVFSEAIAPASIVAAQFGFSPSLTSSAAVLGVDGKTVTVTTSAQTHLTAYAVLLNNNSAVTKVKDLAGNEYVIGNDGFHGSFDGF